MTTRLQVELVVCTYIGSDGMSGNFRRGGGEECGGLRVE